MKTVVDASAFAKRYVRESGSEKLETVLSKTSNLGISVLLVPEVISALNRRQREGRLSEADYATLKQQLLLDARDATVLQVTPPVVASAVRLLENNVLRAMDALHIAAAIQWHADCFVTADIRQISAAENAGPNTVFLGSASSDLTG